MDVNHGKSFLVSLKESERILGNQSDFSVLKRVVFESREYMDTIKTLHDKLVESPSIFKNKWGDKWYYRYLGMFQSELISIDYRKSSDEVLRERSMFEFIKEQREELSSKNL